MEDKGKSKTKIKNSKIEGVCFTQRRKGAKGNFSLRLCVFFAFLRETNSRDF
jgi:hypothetical protein